MLLRHYPGGVTVAAPGDRIDRLAERNAVTAGATAGVERGRQS